MSPESSAESLPVRSGNKNGPRYFHKRNQILLCIVAVGISSWGTSLQVSAIAASEMNVVPGTVTDACNVAKNEKLQYSTCVESQLNQCNDRENSNETLLDTQITAAKRAEAMEINNECGSACFYDDAALKVAALGVTQMEYNSRREVYICYATSAYWLAKRFYNGVNNAVTKWTIKLFSGHDWWAITDSSEWALTDSSKWAITDSSKWAITGSNKWAINLFTGHDWFEITPTDITLIDAQCPDIDKTFSEIRI